MITYNDRLSTPLAVYKPRPWGEGQNTDAPIKSKPDPTSKTNLPKNRMFAKNMQRPLAESLASLHEVGRSHYNKP